MICEYEINGLKLKTGDLICTTDGDDEDIKGHFWRLIGKLIPGDDGTPASQAGAG
jgi:hypothetical protein